MPPRRRNYKGPSTWWGKKWHERLSKRAQGQRVARASKWLQADRIVVPSLGPDYIEGQLHNQDGISERCSIPIGRLSQAAQDAINDILDRQPALAYQLVHRHLPEELDVILSDSGETLLPDVNERIISECDCGVADPPCTHAAAVYMMAGYHFEQNPASLLRARGVNIANIDQTVQNAAAKVRRWSEPGDAVPTQKALETGETASAEAFWGDRDGPLRQLKIPPPEPPVMPAQAARRLGEIPHWDSPLPFLDTIESICKAVDKDLYDTLRKAQNHS